MLGKRTKEKSVELLLAAASPYTSELRPDLLIQEVSREDMREIEARNKATVELAVSGQLSLPDNDPSSITIGENNERIIIIDSHGKTMKERIERRLSGDNTTIRVKAKPRNLFRRIHLYNSNESYGEGDGILQDEMQSFEIYTSMAKLANDFRVTTRYRELLDARKSS